MTNLTHYNYNGRIDNPEVKERLHQVVDTFRHHNIISGRPVFIGFSSDEGVGRNKGRLGAKEGPFKVRELMASMPCTAPVYDYGTVPGTSDLERSQENLGDAVSAVLKAGGFPLIIGGGHETLYGHYLGVRKAFPDKKMAVVNFDAHFDLRNESPSSGTMFHQMLSSDDFIDYYVYGIQTNGNTKTLFETADNFNVKYSTIEEMRATEVFLEEMKLIQSEYDVVFVTLCMDAVKESDAPGVSAPSANGFTSEEIHRYVKHLQSLTNLVSFDISEVSPPLDINDRTSRLAASIFNIFLTK